MDFRFLEAWDAFLPAGGGHLVSLCGGGGKTSLLAAGAAALRARGARVAVTTTTRTEPLAWPLLRVLEWEDVAAGAGRDADLLFVRRGRHADGKWRGLAPREADALGGLLPDHVVLVEADGSGQRPVKLHRDDEPIWPARTSLAVVVMGLGAVGRPIGEVLQRHGRLPAPSLPDDPAAPWDWESMFRLLAGTGGYLARVPVGVPRVVALTQLAACADSPGLFAFVGRVMAEADVPLVVLGELAGERPSLRTAWRVGPGDAGRRGRFAVKRPCGTTSRRRREQLVRRDHAVILARGASQRMGRPKGGCPSGLPGRTCLQAVADLYAAAGWPLAVVTTPALVQAYRPLLVDGPPTRWILREPGGDTAATVVAALEELGTEATYLWLHPVDLPGVRPASISRLLRESLLYPGSVLVPEHAGVPGHPVVLPVPPVLSLRGTCPEGGMRALLLAAARGEGQGPIQLRAVPVDDPGVTADLDTPDDQAPTGAPFPPEEER